ncbi:MAG: hypothetical protein KJI71_05380 [Patescibacteria group bacterium]|nr:hypothetical protein [Patescibacteria group bacterium]
MTKKKPNRYWKKPENILAEARRFLEEHNLKILSRRELELGYPSLSAAISGYPGGAYQLRKDLGEEITTKPKGYWKAWDNIQVGLEDIIEGLGHFPTQKELKDVGCFDLLYGIAKYHGGINEVKLKLGYELGVRPQGYWQEWRNLERELRPFVEELGRLPNKEELREKNLTHIEAAILKYHGGVENVRRRFDLSTSNRKPKGYWKDICNVILEAEFIKSEYGFDTLPSPRELSKLGHSSLVTSTCEYHGGFAKIRLLLGENIPEAKADLQDLDVIKKEIRKIMEEHRFDFIPSQVQLQKLGRYDLSSAISTHHGGFRKFRELMGEEQRKVEPGLWQNEDYAIQRAREVMEELNADTLPSFNSLHNAGYSSLAFAIGQYHGGMTKFRKKLGEENIRAEVGIWRNLDYTLKATEDFMKEHGFDTLPGVWTLNKLNYSSLGAAIQKYHGGFYKFRKILGQQQIRRKDNTWKDPEYAIKQAEEIMQRHGFEELPSERELKKMRCSSLSSAIYRYYGGFRKFRELLRQRQGLPSERQQLEGMLETYVEGAE